MPNRARMQIVLCLLQQAVSKATMGMGAYQRISSWRMDPANRQRQFCPTEDLTCTRARVAELSLAPRTKQLLSMTGWGHTGAG